MPSMNATGMNTAAIENVVAMTASPISDVPNSAASRRGRPSSMCRKTFSSTTIASSISMPTESDKASSVIMFRLKPKASRNMNVPTMEVGIATAEMIVLVRLRRKKKMTSTAKSPPTTRWNFTSSTECSMYSEVSVAMIIR